MSLLQCVRDGHLGISGQLFLPSTAPQPLNAAASTLLLSCWPLRVNHQSSSKSKPHGYSAGTKVTRHGRELLRVRGFPPMRARAAVETRVTGLTGCTKIANKGRRRGASLPTTEGKGHGWKQVQPVRLAVQRKHTRKTPLMSSVASTAKANPQSKPQITTTLTTTKA